MIKFLVCKLLLLGLQPYLRATRDKGLWLICSP